MLKKIIGIFVVLLGMSVSIVSSDKASVEQYYTQIAQQGLDALFGKGQAVVRVSVNMTEPRYDVRYTRASKVEKSTQKSTDGKMNILPGYSVIKNLAPENSQKLPFDSVTNYVSSAITQINVYVLINKSLPKNIASKAEPTLTDLLGLKQGRDSFRLDFKPFYNASEDQKSTDKTKNADTQKESGFNFQTLFNLLFFLLGCVFIIIYIVMGRGQTQKSESQGKSQTNVSVSPSIELKDKSSSSSSSQQITINSQPNIKQFFNFVTEKNVYDLIFLIKKENIGPEYISIMLSFLSGSVASTLFKSLSIEEKALISSQLSEQKMMNRDMLDKFENKIRIALECFVGGENTIKHLFDDVKNEEKKSILNLLKTSQPESFHRLRKFIVTFEDLIVLSDEDMKRLIGEVNIELIAAALQNADQVLYQHFDENLTTNARAMVSEFLELKSKNITKKEIESAQEYILNIAERFDAQGVIGFKDKLNLS